MKMNLAAKSIINLTGIYSRWDILRLAVSEGEYSPVQPMESWDTQVSDKADEVEQLKARIRVLEAKLDALERRGRLGDAPC